MLKKPLKAETILIVLLAILLTGCASTATQPAIAPTAVPTAAPSPIPASISLADLRGQTITLAGPAQSIVSLAPSTTEILFALGAGKQVVARDTFSDYPEESKALPDIGGGFGELNLEGILSHQPDLILASDLTPPEQIKSLEDAGLTVFVLPNPKDFEGMYGTLEMVAQLTGHQPETAALIETLKARVAAVVQKTSGVTDRPLVFYEIDATDPNAVWTPGPGTFIDTLINLAGGENLGAELEGDWTQISLEAIIDRNPDLILLGDATWGGVTVESVGQRAGWEALGAVKNGQVFPFDDNLVSRPGPRLVDGLEAMARLLHPDLFQ